MYEKLASLRQTRGLEKYVQQFELLVAQTSTTEEDQLLGYFLAELRHDIRGQVRPHTPKELLRAMELARDVEYAMRETLNVGGAQSRGVGAIFRPQGGGLMSRTNTYGGSNNTQGTNGSGRAVQECRRISTTYSAAKPRKNGGWVSRSRAARTQPYQEYIKRMDGGTLVQEAAPCPSLLASATTPCPHQPQVSHALQLPLGSSLNHTLLGEMPL